MIDCKDLLLKGRGDFYGLIKEKVLLKLCRIIIFKLKLNIIFYLFDIQLIVVITTHKAMVSINKINNQLTIHLFLISINVKIMWQQYDHTTLT